jgi:hypothetical protein
MNLYHKLCGCVRIRLSRTELRQLALDRTRLTAGPSYPPVEWIPPADRGVPDRHSHRSPFRTMTPGRWFPWDRADGMLFDPCSGRAGGPAGVYRTRRDGPVRVERLGRSP